MFGQDLNFEGGPWKLRNGETVDKLVFKIEEECYFSTEDCDNVWDKLGKEYGGNTNLDIVESLHNWKYMREKGLSE